MCLITILWIGLTSCTYKSPSTEVPTPSDTDIPKSFFVKTEIDPKTKKEVTVHKKFLCGWSSESEAGMAEMFYRNNMIVPRHCNLIFEITEGKLIGKMVNPTFPNDTSKWEIAMTIPISSHYYVEKEKDGSGRETNRIIRNSTRSHWSARPNLDLALDGTNLEANFISDEALWGMSGLGNISVDQIDFDQANGFLGFTLSKGTGYGSYARIRFNIKEYESNSQFKPTPYNTKNNMKFNALHILGQKAQGVNQILYAGHWDLTKKINIRVWGAPEKYKPVIAEIVTDWNNALREAKATTLTDGPFVITEAGPKDHAFDLRYPTFAVVTDEKISSSDMSPLGVGIALADVTNGEIKWGMITLYTGILEKSYKNSLDTSNSAIGAGAKSKMMQFARNLTQFFKSESTPDIPESLRSSGGRSAAPQGLAEYYAKNFNPMLANQQRPDQKADRKQLEEFEKVQKMIGENSEKWSQILQDAHIESVKLLQQSSQIVKSKMAQKGFEGLIDSKLLTAARIEQQKNAPMVGSASGSSAKTTSGSKAETYEEMLLQRYSGASFCFDRTIADVLPAMIEAKSESTKEKQLDDEKIFRNIIKELASHEFGHFLGLGHQFKENILPEKGTVPDSIYNSLAEKATAERSYTNYSSVMGYRSPSVEMKDTSEVKPGPHDILVLRYLYAQQYSTFKSGDSQFTFFDVPVDGIVPDENPQKLDYKTSYFPQCNDIQASYNFDPYCNRFDIGPQASTLVENYFKELKNNLVQILYAFTDARGGNANYREYRLWSSAMTMMSRVRLFYDYMRKTYKAEFDKIKNDDTALMKFSEACQSENVDSIENEILKKMLVENPQLKDLCKANLTALNEMEKFLALNASDVTKMSLSGQFSPGGMYAGDANGDWSRVSGNWEELGAYPLKHAALYALTTPNSWNMWEGVWIWPNPLFATAEDGYSYMYLYPREFTRIMATNVKKNLKFASLGQGERTTMGHSVLSLTWMNFMSKYQNNDSSYFSASHVNKVRDQQEMNVSLVAVILKGKPRDKGDQMRAVRWDGQVYDLNSGKSTPLDSAFILPDGRFVARSPQMFLYPLNDFKPFADFEGYYFAIRIDYARDTADGLSDLSVKNDLKDYYNRLYDACVNGFEGQDNGLSKFFSMEEDSFTGFEMGPSLARSEEKIGAFKRSVVAAYKSYYSFEKFKSAPPKPETCYESLRGLGLIVTTAASINGMWLPQLFDYNANK